jgi:hypothetical protein
MVKRGSGLEEGAASESAARYPSSMLKRPIGPEANARAGEIAGGGYPGRFQAVNPDPLSG